MPKAPCGAFLVWAKVLERVMGIEPTLFAWEARVLPLNDTRDASDCTGAWTLSRQAGREPWQRRCICRRRDAIACSLRIYPVDGSGQPA